MSNFEVIKLNGISAKDNIIALMGPTGAGKSTFINIATRQDGGNVGHSLGSFTANIEAVRVTHTDTKKPIVFIDTPGFDDTHKSDTEILKLIAAWLENTYKNKIKLAGIIYVHRISDNRMAGSPFRNLRMFGQLCGTEAIQNVVLATTMWSMVPLEVGMARESELRDTYWKPMLTHGSATARFTNTFESAWRIVDSIIEKGKVNSLLLQEELVDLNRRLSETQAGQTLYIVLQSLLADQKKMIRKLRADTAMQHNQVILDDLNEEWERLQQELQRTFDQIEEIRVPLGRRVRLLFTLKKSRAHALEMFEI